jgi:hypothetical protein
LGGGKDDSPGWLPAFELEGFDPESTKIVLNVFHGKTRRVLRTVDLDLLAKIAAVVDDLKEPVQFNGFLSTWIQGLGTVTQCTKRGRLVTHPKEGYNRDRNQCPDFHCSKIVRTGQLQGWL